MGIQAKVSMTHTKSKGERRKAYAETTYKERYLSRSCCGSPRCICQSTIRFHAQGSKIGRRKHQYLCHCSGSAYDWTAGTAKRKDGKPESKGKGGERLTRLILLLNCLLRSLMYVTSPSSLSMRFLLRFPRSSALEAQQTKIQKMQASQNATPSIQCYARVQIVIGGEGLQTYCKLMLPTTRSIAASSGL